MCARPLTHPISFSLSVYNAQKPLVSEFIRSSLVYFTMEIFLGEVGKVEWIAFNIGIAYLENMGTWDRIRKLIILDRFMILQKGLECQYWFFCRFWSVFTVFTKILWIKLCTCTNLGYISYWLQSKIRLGYMQWEKMKNLTFANEKICSILQNCYYTLCANSLCFFNFNLESAKKKKGPSTLSLKSCQDFHSI